MNAIFREDWEASVLTNEAIEVHLNYLRPAVENLSAEIKAVSKELASEIKAVSKDLTGKIEAVDTKLSCKIDAVDKKPR